MDVSKISDADQQAVRQAMQYWVEHWDQECATLFGIELDELRLALHRWPLLLEEVEPGLEAAAIGALRELLYGASSLPRAAVQGAIGISFDQAEALIETLNDD